MWSDASGVIRRTGAMDAMVEHEFGTSLSTACSVGELSAVSVVLQTSTPLAK